MKLKNSSCVLGFFVLILGFLPLISLAVYNPPKGHDTKPAVSAPQKNSTSKVVKPQKSVTQPVVKPQKKSSK